MPASVSARTSTTRRTSFGGRSPSSPTSSRAARMCATPAQPRSSELRLRAAEGVALRELELPRLHVPLERDLRSVVGVPRTGILDLDVEVRRDAWPENF